MNTDVFAIQIYPLIKARWPWVNWNRETLQAYAEDCGGFASENIMTLVQIIAKEGATKPPTGGQLRRRLEELQEAKRDREGTRSERCVCVSEGWAACKANHGDGRWFEQLKITQQAQAIVKQRKAKGEKIGPFDYPGRLGEHVQAALLIYEHAENYAVGRVADDYGDEHGCPTMDAHRKPIPCARQETPAGSVVFVEAPTDEATRRAHVLLQRAKREGRHTIPKAWVGQDQPLLAAIRALIGRKGEVTHGEDLGDHHGPDRTTEGASPEPAASGSGADRGVDSGA